MDFRYGLLAMVCIALVIAAGCMGSPAADTPVQTTAPAQSPPVLFPPVPSPSFSGTPGASCSEDVCSYIPVPSPVTQDRSLRIAPSPLRYSPLMSSTPGICLEPVTTGFNATDATFTWNASYGQFLSGDAPSSPTEQSGASVSGPGKKIYWSFVDKPLSGEEPVIITVTAKDPESGAVWGSSAVTLFWDSNYSVTVQNQG